MARVQTDELISLQTSPGRVRNMCILAHVDHGKTTLSDLLVSSNGIISERQAGKLRFLDSMEDEQVRGITMRASAISLVYEEKKRKLGIGNNSMKANTACSPVECNIDEAEQQKKKYLVNLIDSPGHIDFCSDVSTATRLCDGALVVVDAVEGVCVQTHAVLRQAWLEKMKPCLVLNKIDRLAVELKLDPSEAYERLIRTVERVNALAASLVLNRTVGEDLFNNNADQEKALNKLEEDWTFSPEKGNVIFASAIDGWAFNISDFARMWAPRIGAKPKLLREYLWGNFGYNQKTNKVIKLRQGGAGESSSSLFKPMFVSLILEPIFNLYDAAQHDVPKALKMATRLGIEIPTREVSLAERDGGLARSLLSRWLPLANAVLLMAVEHMPCAEEGQSDRITALFSNVTDISSVIEGQEDSSISSIESVFSSAASSIHQSVAACNRDSSLTVAFISKLTSVDRKELMCLDGKTLWQSPYQDNNHPETNMSNSGAEDQLPSEVLVAFARVFSGTLYGEDVSKLDDDDDEEQEEEEEDGGYMYLLGPKYDPCEHLEIEQDENFQYKIMKKSTTQGHVTAITSQGDSVLNGQESFSLPTINTNQHTKRQRRRKRRRRSPIALYLMMGDSFVPVASVPAGSLCAIAGLDAFSTAKCATLVVGHKWGCLCTPFKPLAMQARPILRVAVEPESAADVGRLEAGLLKLQRSDPAAEIDTTKSGEQVVAALGELHLEQCLKELVQRHSPGLAIRVSPPIHTFREGLEDIKSNGGVEVDQGADSINGATGGGGGGGAYHGSKINVEAAELSLGAQLKTPPWVDEEGVPYVLYGGAAARVPSLDGCCALTARVRALPEEIVLKLEEYSSDDVTMVLKKVKQLQQEEQNKSYQTTTTTTADDDNDEVEKKESLDSLDELSLSLFNFLRQMNESSDFEIESFGPSGKGTNILIRSSTFRIQSHASSAALCRYLASQHNARGKIVTPLLRGIARNNLSHNTTTTIPSSAQTIADNAWVVDDSYPFEPSESLPSALTELETSLAWKHLALPVAAGFQLATSSGPLAEEEVYGVCFMIEEMDMVKVSSEVVEEEEKNAMIDSSQENDVVTSIQAMFGFQLSKMAKNAFRAALLSSPNIRLVEGQFKCSLQCSASQLRNLYAVLSKRRGTVLQDEMVEGTDLFIISALLPVVMSSGFSTELLGKTSGAATAPLLSFSHWSVIRVDPFWRPTTAEERDEHGESYVSYERDIKGNMSRCFIDELRKRKGLAVEEKIVANAEKQRTLKRNK